MKNAKSDLNATRIAVKREAATEKRDAEGVAIGNIKVIENGTSPLRRLKSLCIIRKQLSDGLFKK